MPPIRVEIQGHPPMEFPEGTDPKVIDMVVKRDVVGKDSISSAETPQEQEGFFSSVGSDIARRAGNIADIFSKNVPSGESLISSIKMVPSRILQTGGQGAGLITDVAAEGMKAGYRAIVPESAQEFISSGIKSGVEMARPLLEPISKAYSEVEKRYPEGVRNIEAVANIAGAIPIVKGVTAAARVTKATGDEIFNIAKDIYKIAVPPSDIALTKKLDRIIRGGVEKAIRPSVVGKKNIGQINDYFNKSTEAVKNIVVNKESLVLTNVEGKVIKGALPSSLNQFSEAIDQTKKNIFKQYDAMAKTTGDIRSRVPLNSVVKELTGISQTPTLQDLSPGVVQYAKTRAASFAKRGFYTTEEAQDAISQLNKSLEAFYKNPSYENASKAGIDAMIANNLRKTLDGVIENIHGEGYQKLKNAYGSLKTIEKDVAHRAIIDARKNIKGLIDFSDIFTSGELVAGLATMNPAMIVKAGAWKGVKEYFKFINDPNQIVKRMFGDAEKIINSRDKGFKSKLFQPKTTLITKQEIPRGIVLSAAELQKRKIIESTLSDVEKAALPELAFVDGKWVQMPQGVKTERDIAEALSKGIEAKTMPTESSADVLRREADRIRTGKVMLPPGQKVIRRERVRLPESEINPPPVRKTPITKGATPIQSESIEKHLKRAARVTTTGKHWLRTGKEIRSQTGKFAPKR